MFILCCGHFCHHCKSSSLLSLIIAIIFELLVIVTAASYCHCLCSHHCHLCGHHHHLCSFYCYCCYQSSLPLQYWLFLLHLVIMLHSVVGIAIIVRSCRLGICLPGSVNGNVHGKKKVRLLWEYAKSQLNYAVGSHFPIQSTAPWVLSHFSVLGFFNGW